MRTTWGGRARRGWSRMDSLWVVPRAKLGRFGNDEKASCVTVSRRRSVLLSPSAARSTTSSLPFVAMYRRTWGSALSILILLFHSASSVFRASSFPFFSRSLSSFPLCVLFFRPLLCVLAHPSLSLSLLDDLIVRSAHESSTSLFPPSVKFTFRPSPPSGPIYPPPSPAPSTFRSTITYGSIGYGR